jgi:hypothetical protein
MPTISNVSLSIVKDVANAEIQLAYDIEWDPFEQSSNIPFDEAWKLVGDDTNSDGDNLPLGDDPISLGLVAITRVSSNGQAVTHRTKSRTIAFSSLNEDTFSSGDNDDEIRAVVTLTPQLPAQTSRESNLVSVLA